VILFKGFDFGNAEVKPIDVLNSRNILTLKPDILSSWTLDKKLASQYGSLLMARVEKEDIWATPINFGLADRSEVLLLGKKCLGKSLDNFNIPVNNMMTDVAPMSLKVDRKEKNKFWIKLIQTEAEERDVKPVRE
jgi:hypothetical protein